MYEGLRACLNAVVHPHIMKRSNIKVIAVATVAIVIVLLFSTPTLGTTMATTPFRAKSTSYTPTTPWVL